MSEGGRQGGPVEGWPSEHIPTRRRLGFVAIGESTSGHTAAEAEEMLAEGFGR